MLYEAKQGTKAYEYIKGILDAEEKEYRAYMKRVHEAFELDIEENAFSSYVMTLSQKWYKLGNIHAGIGFLIEKPEDKEE